MSNTINKQKEYPHLLGDIRHTRQKPRREYTDQRTNKLIQMHDENIKYKIKTLISKSLFNTL